VTNLKHFTRKNAICQRILN